jgi:DNA primase
MFYPEELVEEVRQRNDIVDVISSYVKLTQRGSNYMGLCPFHGEKTPSFSVSRSKQMYHCFGCGVGGNVFTFLMEYDNCTFVEAMKALAERAGVSLPQAEDSKEARRLLDIKSRLLEVNKLAAKYYYYQLCSPQGSIAMEYLKKRALEDSTIKGFGLGYSSKYGNDLYRYLKTKGYDDELLKESGLFTMDEAKGAYDKFWNRVMFPIMDVNSRVIGFGGRVMGDGTPKYLNSPETKLFDKSRNLYGLNEARKSRKKNILLCEGYMDVISLHQAGFQNAVASLGTAFTGLQANLLKRYTDEVLVTYDSDGAGTKAALRAIPILKEAGISVKIVNMQPYKDPDEFIKGLGAKEFEKRLDEAENSFYFEIRVLEKDYDLADPEGKTKFFHEVAKKLTDFKDEIERNNYIEAMDRKYHIGFDNLRRLVNQYGSQLIGTASYGNSYGAEEEGRRKREEKKEDGALKSQKLLLTWLIEDTSLFSKLKGVITERDFRGEPYQQVAELLFSQYEKEGEVTPAKIINHFESKEEQRQAAKLFQTGFQEDMSLQEREKAFNDLVKRVRGASLEYEIQNLTDISGLQRLIEEQKNLQNLHISLEVG